MILNGKCKEGFDNYFWSRFNEQKGINTHEFLKELEGFRLLEQVIIEYFDSAGIIIIINNVCGDWWYRIKSESSALKSEKYNELKSRQEAIEKAIIKANQIYNG